MGKTQDVLIQEVFAYHVAVRFRCGREAKEFEARLGESHVDALLHLAARIQDRIEARGPVVPAGRVQ